MEVKCKFLRTVILMKKTILMMIFSFVISISVANANYYENDPIFNGSYDLFEMTTGYDVEGIVDPNIDFLALRTGPSVDYPLITRIPPGAHVYISSGRGGYSETNWGKYFVEVTYRGMNGYAHSKYITIIPRTIKKYP